MGASMIPLMGQAPQVQSPTEVANAAAILASRNLANQESQQAIQSNAIDLKQKQQAVQDQKTLMDALSANKGDMSKALPSLAGKISPQTYLALQAKDLEIRKSNAEIDDKELNTKKDQLDRLTALHHKAINVPDDQYATQWPTIAAAANQINPQLKLDPANPVPKEQLEAHGIGLQTEDQYLKQEQERRAQATATAELPQKKTQAAQAELSLVGQYLGNAKNQQDWQNGLTQLQDKVSKSTYASLPQQFSPEAAQRALQLSVPPEKAATMPVDRLEMNDWLKNHPGKGPADFMAYKATLVPQFNFSLQGGMGGGLTDAARDQAAEKYWQTGQLPTNLGRGAAGSIAAKAIMNRAAELHAGGSLAANSAEFKANSESLKSLQKLFDGVTSFENTAIKNLDQVAQAGARVPDLSTRFANKPVRAIGADVIGTPEMAAFRTALLTAQNEAAKVLTSSNASGVLSDSARHEAQDVLDGNLPFPAMMSSINQLKTDFKNRHDSYADQISDIKKRLGDSGGSGGGSSASFSAKAPNGKTYTFKDQASLDAFKKATKLQ